ncbi:MAG: FAD binding domain-containing protein, partial [Propionibacteriaceae bacterium]
MDLNTVQSVRTPQHRAELGLQPGEAFLAGGTWLFSEPQLTVSGLVDLTTLGWPNFEVTDDGLDIAATCTLADLLRLEPAPSWRAFPLFSLCVNSLVASFKIHNLATVGGNLCTALPAGSIIALTAGLDARAVIWSPDGSERELPVVDFVLGVRRTALRPGELLRSVRISRTSLE